MARKDAIHDAVKNALIKDDWTITHDPIIIDIVDTKIEADLAAEKIIVAEKEKLKLL